MPLNNTVRKHYTIKTKIKIQDYRPSDNFHTQQHTDKPYQINALKLGYNWKLILFRELLNDAIHTYIKALLK